MQLRTGILTEVQVVLYMQYVWKEGTKEGRTGDWIRRSNGEGETKSELTFFGTPLPEMQKKKKKKLIAAKLTGISFLGSQTFTSTVPSDRVRITNRYRLSNQVRIIAYTNKQSIIRISSHLISSNTRTPLHTVRSMLSGPRCSLMTAG